MNEPVKSLVARVFLTFVCFEYVLVGWTGLNKNEIIITNFLSYFAVVDPYLLLFAVAQHPFSQGGGLTGIVHFDHIDIGAMYFLSWIVISMGVVGVLSCIALARGIRMARYVLATLIIFLSFAALLNLTIFSLAWIPAYRSVIGIAGDATILNFIPSILWATSYWFAYRKLSFDS